MTDFHTLCRQGWQLKVVRALEDKVAVVGERVEFSVELSEPVPAAEVAWYANGAEIKSSDLWTKRADGSSYRLILRQAPILPQQEITFAARDALSLAKLTIISKCLECFYISNTCFSVKFKTIIVASLQLYPTLRKTLRS